MKFLKLDFLKMEFSSFFELGDGWSFGSILVKVNQSSKYLAWRGASKKVERPRPHIICVIAANNVTFSLKYHCPIAPAILNNCLMLNQHLARQEQNANYVTSILVLKNFSNLETLSKWWTSCYRHKLCTRKSKKSCFVEDLKKK